MYELYKKYLAILSDTGKYRKLSLLDKTEPGVSIDFSTNDYLNLSRHPEVIKAALFAAECHGVGATGSRLLSGNSILFESLEMKIAEDKKTEAALIFNSGFQTNLSVLSALLDTKVLGVKPIVFFDKLNHASLYQAIFLSDVELVRYRHNDISHLSLLLNKYKLEMRPKFIVTETIFGMDGDILPLDKVVALAKEYDVFLYLDEAHATGILGPHGYGLSTTVNLENLSYLIMGTFSKALGCSGGYVACDHLLKEYLINKASGFIYATANSPMVIGAATKAWAMIKYLHQERDYLMSLSALLRTELLALGFNIGDSASHIIPIILGSEGSAIFLKETLLQNGIMVSCIRPPTVPPGTSRIRIALNAQHKLEDIMYLIEILKKSCVKL